MYRVVLETSTEVQPISGGVNPENSGFLHSEVFFYNILDAMTFQKEEPDGSWSDVDAIAVSPYNYMMETGLAPLTPFNYRALQEVEIKQLVDSISIDLLQLDIEWELIDGTYPVLVYRYTGNSTTPYELFDTLPAGTQTLTLSGTSEVEIPDLVFYADRPDPASDMALQASYTFITHFSWEAVEGALEYGLSHGTGTETRTTETTGDLSWVGTPYAGERQPTSFIEPEVSAITGSELQEIPSHSYVHTDLTYSGSPYKTYQLQYRIGMDEPWLDAGTTTNPSRTSRELETDIVPEYRITGELTIPASSIGICQFDTRVPDGLDEFPGSIPVDGNGNRHVGWLGYYWYSPDMPGIYFSEDLGIIQPVAAEPSGWWVWTPRTGWTLWLENHPGILYAVDRGNWFFHVQGSSWYYNFNGQAFEELLP